MKRLAYLISVIVTVAVGGCALPNSQAEPSDREAAQIGIVNHTGNYIYSASVNGAGGGGMSRWGAGGANICCTSIPRTWYAGMKVTVRWNMPVGIKDVVKEKIVEVEKYDRPGDVYLNFFPDDEVRVVVSRNGPRAADYPIRHCGKPWETTH